MKSCTELEPCENDVSPSSTGKTIVMQQLPSLGAPGRQWDS